MINMKLVIQILLICLVISIVFLIITIFKKEKNAKNNNKIIENFTTTQGSTTTTQGSTTTTQGSTTEEIVDLSKIVNFENSGIAIKNITSNKYLTQNDDGTLSFSSFQLKTEVDKNNGKIIDKCKFTLHKVSGGDNIYFLEANGRIFGSISGLFLKIDKNSTSDKFNEVLMANSEIDNATQIIFTHAEDSNQSLNNKYQLSMSFVNVNGDTMPITEIVLIEHYLPINQKTFNFNYTNDVDYSNQLDDSVDICSGDNENKISDFTVDTINNCALKCDDNTNCNYYTYNFFGNTTDGPNCKLYKDCVDDNRISIDKNNDNFVDISIPFIMKKNKDNQESIEQQKQESILINQKHNAYKNNLKLMEENDNLIKQVQEKLDDVKKMEQIPIEGDTDNQAYLQVINHKNIMENINNPEKLQDIRFNISQHVQDSKIQNLEEELSNIENLKMKNVNYINSNNKEDTKIIKSIKNIQNSKILNVHLPDDISPEDVDNHEYMVFGNGKCLSFKKTKNNEDKLVNEYKFVDCNRQEPEQLFKIDKVYNKNQYNNKINNPIHQITSTKFDTMGFYAVSPKDDLKECLTLNDDGLTIQPCDLNSNQRYTVFNKIVPC